MVDEIKDQEESFESPNDSFQADEEMYQSLDESAPEVSEGSKRTLLILIGVILFVFFLVWFFLLRGGDKNDKPPTPAELAGVIPAPGTVVNIDTKKPTIDTRENSGRTPPRLPTFTAPNTPVTAPTPRTIEASPPRQKPPTRISRPKAPARRIGASGIIGGGRNGAQQPTIVTPDMRNSASMFVFGGGGGGGSDESFTVTTANADPKNTIEDSKIAQQVKLTKVQNLRRTILQGKMIDAVLETGVNTKLPGALRGIVTRDVYAEAGREVLIPRGSRIVGGYSVDIKQGQARVYIIWNRLVLPDGYDISLNSQSTDELGRSGVSGQVDNKYFQTFLNSVLLTVLNTGVAVGADKLSGGNDISEQQGGANGLLNRSGNVASIATLEALGDFSGLVKNVIGRFNDTTPYVQLNQGTPVKIYVNKDLYFPSKAETVIVQ